MRRLVVDLYSQVFSFLCLAMSWYAKPFNRFKAALKKNFYDEHFRRPVDSMQKTVKRILDEAEHITQSLVFKTKQNVDLLVALQVTGNESRFDNDEQTNRKFANLGNNVLKTLAALDVDENVESSLVHSKIHVTLVGAITIVSCLTVCHSTEHKATLRNPAVPSLGEPRGASDAATEPDTSTSETREDTNLPEGWPHTKTEFICQVRYERRADLTFRRHEVHTGSDQAAHSGPRAIF